MVRIYSFLFILFMIAGCKNTTTTDIIANGAIVEANEIIRIADRIEKQTADNCKTDALIANIETLRHQAISIETNIKNIKSSCEVEKDVLNKEITLRNTIIIFISILFIMIVFLLVRRKI